MLDIVTNVGVMAVVLMLAEGYCLCRARLQRPMVLACVLGTVTAAHVLLWSWASLAMDPARNLYVYETVPGILLMVVRLGVLVWFWVSLILTVRNDARHRGLYMAIGLGASLWFIMLPLTVAAGAAEGSWGRLKVTTIMFAVTHFVALLALALALWPAVARRLFVLAPADGQDASGAAKGFGGSAAAVVESTPLRAGAGDNPQLGATGGHYDEL